MINHSCKAARALINDKSTQDNSKDRDKAAERVGSELAFITKQTRIANHQYSNGCESANVVPVLKKDARQIEMPAVFTLPHGLN